MRKRERERERERERARARKRERERERARDRKLYSCCECSIVIPTLFPAIRRAQANSSLEKKLSLPRLIVISGLGGNQFTCNSRVAAI